MVGHYRLSHRADEPEYTDPARALKEIQAYPETTILMVHMGVTDDTDVSQAVINVAKHAPNVALIGQ